MKLDDLNIAELKGVTQDSRAVKPGYLFAALSGAQFDGADYIEESIQNGADYILCTEGFEVQGSASFICVENPRAVFSDIVTRFYKDQPAHIVAVTGTNGKSSVVEFVRQLWAGLGLSGAAMGTLGLQSEALNIDGNMTTPEVVKLHETLKTASEAGITHLAMEASSHGLDQYRMHGARLKAAAFTNLSHDHLDYHGDMDSYLIAKAKLFSEVLPEGVVAVLNADIPEFKTLKEICEQRNIQILDYGREAISLKINSIQPQSHGQSVSCEIEGSPFEFETALVGEFQIYNMLCAAGLVMACGADQAKVLELFPQLSGVRGRLEFVPGHPSGAGIYVDYAHTPDALEKVLKALRAHTTGRLISLFGCGGDRDKTKRPEMGEMSGELADITIVTDDNPRFEDPTVIRKEIIAAVPEALEIDGRAEAIFQATSMLQEGDVLLVAGKGHEQGQVFADRTEPFDDREQILKSLETLNAEKMRKIQ